MAVNYSLAYMSSNPSKKDAPKLYYAKAQATGEVKIDEIASDIAYATSMTDGDVLNAIRGLITQLNKHLAAGKIVRLENFGSFQLQLESSGAETPKQFKTSNITGCNIQFRPGRTIKAATRAIDLTFQRVTSKKQGSVIIDDETENEGSTGDDTQLEDPLG
ncbi:MAG: hypothetical protein E7099_06495 [Mediterranea massiliensis]|nr:hypothetical protein [Mediterranea massiliensis]